MYVLFQFLRGMQSLGMGFAQKELSMDITSPQGRLSEGHLKRVVKLGWDTLWPLLLGEVSAEPASMVPTPQSPFQT